MKKENIGTLKEFILLVRDILHSEEFGKMKSYRHHIRATLYDHSVKVAYLCFKHYVSLSHTFAKRYDKESYGPTHDHTAKDKSGMARLLLR